MDEFIVIVEADADFQIATKLAERVLVEKIDWLEPEILSGLFRWSGLLENTPYSCWKDIQEIIFELKKIGYRPPRYIGHAKDGTVLKAYGASTIKVLNSIRFLQKTRSITSVVLIYDIDDEPERKDGIEQARSEHIDRSPPLKIAIGIANRKREAWVLNGFIASTADEIQTLAEIKTKLTFDPCKESHRLGSKSKEDPDRIRNPKFVLARLTDENLDREKQCWEETDLDHLRKTGNETGLSSYIEEIEQRLLPLLDAENRST